MENTLTSPESLIISFVAQSQKTAASDEYGKAEDEVGAGQELTAVEDVVLAGEEGEVDEITLEA